MDSPYERCRARQLGSHVVAIWAYENNPTDENGNSWHGADAVVQHAIVWRGITATAEASSPQHGRVFRFTDFADCVEGLVSWRRLPVPIEADPPHDNNEYDEFDMFDSGRATTVWLTALAERLGVSPSPPAAASNASRPTAKRGREEEVPLLPTSAQAPPQPQMRAAAAGPLMAALRQIEMGGEMRASVLDAVAAHVNEAKEDNIWCYGSIAARASSFGPAAMRRRFLLVAMHLLADGGDAMHEGAHHWTLLMLDRTTRSRVIVDSLPPRSETWESKARGTCEALTVALVTAEQKAASRVHANVVSWNDPTVVHSGPQAGHECGYFVAASMRFLFAQLKRGIHPEECVARLVQISSDWTMQSLRLEILQLFGLSLHAALPDARDLPVDEDELTEALANLALREEGEGQPHMQPAEAPLRTQAEAEHLSIAELRELTGALLAADVRVVRMINKRVRVLFTRLFTRVLEALSNALTSVGIGSADAQLMHYLMLPKVVLRPFGSRGELEDRCRTAETVSGCAQLAKLILCEQACRPRVADAPEARTAIPVILAEDLPPGIRNFTFGRYGEADEDALLAAAIEKATNLASIKEIAAARRALSLSTPARSTLAYEALKAKHPSRPEGVERPPEAPAIDLAPLSPTECHRLIFSVSKISAAGPNGLSAAHVRTFAADPIFVHAVVGVIQHLFDAFEVRVSSAGKALFASARLTALIKQSADHALARLEGGTDVRPIACGDMLRRLAAKFGMARVSIPGLLADGKQVAISVPSGIEGSCAMWRRFSMTARNRAGVCIKIDKSNAFNSLSRVVILEACTRWAPALLSFVWACYGQPAPLFFGPRPPIMSEEGVQQGDPLGPLLYALGEWYFLCLTRNEFQATWSVYATCPPPDIVCSFYLDDSVFGAAAPASTDGGDLAHVRALAMFVRCYRDVSRRFGSHVNARKSELVCTPDAAVTDTVLEMLPEFAICRRRPLADWALLGSPVGFDLEATVEALKTLIHRCDTVLKRIASLCQADLLAGFWLLRATWSGVAGFYARALGVVAAGELTTLHDRVMQCLESVCPFLREARDQVSLPPRLGGLGLRDWAKHAAHAYLCMLHVAQPVGLALAPEFSDAAAYQADVLRSRCIEMLAPTFVQPSQREVGLARKQRAMSIDLDDLQAATVFSRASPAHQATLLSLQCPYASAYLYAIAQAPCERHLVTEEVAAVWALRFGALEGLLVERCPWCGTRMTLAHAYWCESRGLRTRMHHSLVLHFLNLVNAPQRSGPVLAAHHEPTDLTALGRRERTDVRLDIRGGERIYLDFFIIAHNHTLARCAEAGAGPGEHLVRYADREKRPSYEAAHAKLASALQTRCTFYPVGFDLAGGLAPPAAAVLTDSLRHGLVIFYTGSAHQRVPLALQSLSAHLQSLVAQLLLPIVHLP